MKTLTINGTKYVVIDEAAAAKIQELSEKIAKLPTTGAGTNGDDYSFLTGLKYYAIGDSIVDYQGTTGSPETYSGTDLQGTVHTDETVIGYIQAIESRYGFVCTNFGAAGHTLVQDYSTLVGKDYSNVALVTIAYGCNDARTNVPLGTVNSNDETTFAGALNNLLKKIYTDNPECRVVVLTPIQRLYVSDFGIATANANGKYLIDFVDICKKVAAKRSTMCIDMYRDSGINQTNLYYYTREGVHPLNTGYLRMTGALIPVLDGLFAVDYNPFGTMTNISDTEPDEPGTDTGTGEGETPPEEDPSSGTVDLTDLFVLDGYYWGVNASITGEGTYDGIEPLLLEVGRTYTLTTIMGSTAVYAGGLITGEGFTYASVQFNVNKNAASTETVTINGTDYNKVTFTFTPSEDAPYVVFGKAKAAEVSMCSLRYI